MENNRKIKSNIFRLAQIVCIFVLITSSVCQSGQQPTKPENPPPKQSQPTHTKPFMESCMSKGMSRNSLIVPQSQRTRELEGVLKSYFKIDGSKVIKYAMNGQRQQWKNEVNGNFGPIFLLMFPFILGSVALLIVGPCLVFCCLRPLIFRKFKFWEQDTQPWALYQIIVPLILALLCLIGVIILVIVGFTKIAAAQQAYHKSICARAMVFDDALYGNVSPSGAKFLGLHNFMGSVNRYLQNFQLITTSMLKIRSTSEPMVNVTEGLKQSKDLLTDLPNEKGKPIMLFYPSPLNSSKPQDQVQSTLKQTLGTISQSKSLIGLTYNGVNDLQKDLGDITQVSDLYVTISGPSTSNITFVQNDIAQANAAVFSLDQKLQDGTKYFEGPKFVAVASYLSYGFLLGTSVFALLGICMLYAFKKLFCRFLLYLAVLIIFLFSALVFALAITSALAVPASLFFCDFTNGSVSNQRNFDENFKDVIPNNKIRGALSKCMPTSRGTLLNQLSNNEFIKSMVLLPKLMDQLESFNGTQRAELIYKPFDNVGKQIVGTMQAKKLDISSKDTTNLNILTSLSKSYDWQCNTKDFHNDSWVPSINQDPVKIQCKYGLALSADHTTCKMQEDFEKSVEGCVGCMDTYSLFQYTDTQTQVQAALKKRYSDKSCKPFIQSLKNVWNNFYAIKRKDLEPVEKRYNQANPTVTKTYNLVQKNLAPVFTNVLQQLKISAGAYANESKTIGESLSCSLIGEDMVILADNTCGLLLPRVHSLLVINGVLCFLLLFTLCFTNCSIIRCVSKVQAEQQQQNQNNGDMLASQSAKQTNNNISVSNTVTHTSRSNQRYKPNRRKYQKRKNQATHQQLAPSTQAVIDRQKLG